MNEEYIKRMNTVLVYIETNLDTELSLDTISKIACYSPFHTHRLFKAITNETLNSYITRKRIERTAIELIHKKEVTISELALHYGFNSNSSFTRSFKKQYGRSPTDFRHSNFNNFSKIGKTDSKNGKANFITEAYLCNITNLKNWITMNAKIEIKELPELHLACLTQIGVDGLENAFERIVKWARPKGLLEGSDANVARIFHDSFKITDADKVRMSIGVVVPKATATDGEIAMTTLKKGKHLVGHFEIVPEDFGQSWEGLFLWMTENGYKKATSNPFEIYRNNPNEHPEKKCIVDLCIPIE